MLTPTQISIRDHALSQVGAAYIMGATAIPCTPKNRRALADGRSSAYAEQIRANCSVLSGKRSACDGCPYDGRLAFDCAQLSKFAAAAAGVTLPSGSNSQWTKADWGVTGEITALPRDVVCFVFHRNGTTHRMSHVGVYLGDGQVADARGHASGVVLSALASYPWTHFAIPRAVALECGLPMAAATDHPTLRMGTKGDAVRQAQALLNRFDPSLALTADGVFGAHTKAAVRRFQTAQGLTADGIIGENTWAALLSAEADAWQHMDTAAKIEHLYERLLALEGGD